MEQSKLIDSLKQYGRQNCALIHGMPETKDEVTDDVFINTIQEHLGVTLKSCDLARTHRLGERKQGNPANL